MDDIRVGDRVTFSNGEQIIITDMLNISGMQKFLNKHNTLGKQIIKIEKPKYEAVEEKKDKIKKELLTEEKYEIKLQIERIANNSPYSYEETKMVLLKFLEKIEDTGELIKLLGILRMQ